MGKFGTNILLISITLKLNYQFGAHFWKLQFWKHFIFKNDVKFLTTQKYFEIIDIKKILVQNLPISKLC